MKKFLALALALMMGCMMIPAMAEVDVTGEWTLSYAGITLVFTLNEDGSYTLSSGSQIAYQGNWELKGNTVVTDPGTVGEDTFYIDEESLIHPQYGTATREKKEEIVLADVNPDAALEDFSGEWICKYAIQGNSDAIIEMEQAVGVMIDALPTMKIDGVNVTFTGLLFGVDESENAVFADGAISFQHYMYHGVFSMSSVPYTIKLLADGMAVFSAEKNGSFYFTRVEAAADPA